MVLAARVVKKRLNFWTRRAGSRDCFALPLSLFFSLSFSFSLFLFFSGGKNNGQRKKSNRTLREGTMATLGTNPAQAYSASTSASTTAGAPGGIGSERREAPPLLHPRSPAAAEAKTAAAAAAAAARASSPPSPPSSPTLVPVAHSSRGGGIVEAPQGWGQALSVVSHKQQERRKKR